MADEIRTCADVDPRLTPYVDGEDSPVERRDLEQHLNACGPCARAAQEEQTARDLLHDNKHSLAGRAPETLRARCARLSAAGDQLPASGSQLPASSFPSSALRPPPSARRASSVLRKWAPLSLAATLVLAVAGVFVFGLNDRVQALAASLAVDHVKCFKVAGTAASADAHGSEHKWQQDQGWPIVVPQTESAQQLKLVEVRRCFSTDGRAAHMLYTWQGEPLSVYVLQGEAGRDRIVTKMGAQCVIWCANQRTYAVVSSDTTRDLAPIVDYMKTRVR
jgi:anti-sigma factor RsiW